MKISTLLFCFFISFSSIGFGQKVIFINGYLKDSINNEPIANAHILAPDNILVISNEKGHFEFTIKSLPTRIKVTHSSYGYQEITVKKIPENGNLVVRLAPFIHQIEQVQVSGERLRILTKTEDFSISDMAFDKDHLWMIILKNNNISQCLLCLADRYGDIQASKEIRLPAQLSKDVFDNVHLESKDSIYQLYSCDSKSISLLYGENRRVYHEALDPFVEGFADKLVYIKSNQYYEKAVIRYLDTMKFTDNYITQIFDSLEFTRKEFERRHPGMSMWEELKHSRYWKRNTKIAQIYEGFVKAPLFSLNDTLFVVNTYKDSLLRFSPEGKFIRAVPIQFHKDTIFWSVDYKEIRFLSDNSTHSCYLIERESAGWTVHKLNTNTGILEKRIPLPDYPGMTHISIFKNAVYFLYHQKNYPYYVRLYRYQL